MKIITNQKCTAYSHPGHPERPQRVRGIQETLRGQNELELTWTEPTEAPEKSILRAHAPEHLARLTKEEDFDMDTPTYPGISQLARTAAGAAITAMSAAQKADSAFSLMRPPGHHATRNRAMGFCYLNSIAIAALEGLATGTRRIAIFDFDVHHGNGTEAILMNKPGTVFYSIHQFPCYPGTGTRNVGDNCYNFPLPPQTPRAEHRHAIESALDHMGKFKPELVGVSAGFDAFSGDPLAQLKLEHEDYYWLGQSLRKLGIPVFSVLEGGYSDELPNLVLAYLKGLEGK